MLQPNHGIEQLTYNLHFDTQTNMRALGCVATEWSRPGLRARRRPCSSVFGAHRWLAIYELYHNCLLFSQHASGMLGSEDSPPHDKKQPVLALPKPLCALLATHRWFSLLLFSSLLFHSIFLSQNMIISNGKRAYLLSPVPSIKPPIFQAVLEFTQFKLNISNVLSSGLACLEFKA